MTPPDFATLQRVIAAAWPPARTWREGNWTRRDGAGGGGRVSSATAEGPVAIDAESPPLVMVRPGEDALDAALAAAGYDVKDETRLLARPARAIAAQGPNEAAVFDRRTPEMEAIWQAGGIGPARWAIMDRAARPKAWLLAQAAGRPAGTAFAGSAEGIAMVSAIEVPREMRRAGIGRALLRAAAHWAVAQDCAWLALAVTRRNVAANALYEGCGMTEVAAYHYRFRG